MRSTLGTRNRHSIRLHDFDYSSPGAYFVTVCAHNRRSLLDSVSYSDAVHRSWAQLPAHFPSIQLDEIIVMPDHVHFVVILTDENGAAQEGAPRRAPTLANVVRAFKGDATREINRLRGARGAAVWQRNYYEHIVRGERELQRIREYILNNPLSAHTHDRDDLTLAWEEP